MWSISKEIYNMFFCFHLLGAPQQIDQKSTENVDPEIGRFDAKSWFWRPPVVTNGFASKNCAF